MCGIAGLLHFPAPSRSGPPDGGPGSTHAVVERMVGRLRHRGPDGRGVEHANPGRAPAVVLGHTRLAILDPSPAGRQPMANADGSLQITFNGEIYNYLQLRAALNGDGGAWRSRTDTEVILRAYARWGRACLHHLRGMFALAIWDGRRQQLLLARDRLGIKPLYYFSDGSRFLFASEVGALLASGLVPRRLDPVALGAYLAYQCAPAPRTLIEGVRALPPGTAVVVSADGRLSEQRYWDLLDNASPEAAAAPPGERARRVGDLLREAVALHLVSDVPLGAFLSGGIDSSAIVGLMREAGAQPRTFSVAFAEREFDEAAHARRVAARFGTRHTEIRLKQADLLEQLPDALRAMDQPTGDGVNSYLVARAVRAAGVSVALSGLGGDELFGGYPSFARLERSGAVFRAWARLPAPARALAARAVRAAGRSSIASDKLASMLESDGALATLHPLLRRVLPPPQQRGLLEPPWADAVAGVADPYTPILRDAFARHPGVGTLTRVSFAEARTYMHDLLLRDTDQMSMAHALEVRVPLLDHQLVEYVLGLPDASKRGGGTPKPLLVRALAGLLPSETVRRPKQGFTLPLAPWMRGPLRGLCEERLGPARLGGRGIFRPARVRALWADFLADRRTVSWSRVWLLVSLEEWLGRNGF